MATSAKRDLKIKAGSCKRLAKDLQFYLKQKDEQAAKLQTLFEAKADEYDIKKQREFLDETQSTLADISNRAMQAFDELAALMTTLQGLPDVLASDEMKQASQVLEDTRAILASGRGEEKKDVHATSAPTKSALRVAVYGASGNHCVQGGPAWQMALQLGELLAQRGYRVVTHTQFELSHRPLMLSVLTYHQVTGGYSGLMEAVSEGASRVPGAVIEGILCPSAFPAAPPKGNRFLTVPTTTENFPQRLVRFMTAADVFIALPGNIGTLTELMLTWNLSFVNGFTRRPHLPLFCARDPWEGIMKTVVLTLGVSSEVASLIRYFDTAEEASALVDACAKEALGAGAAALAPAPAPDSSSASGAPRPELYG